MVPSRSVPSAQVFYPLWNSYGVVDSSVLFAPNVWQKKQVAVVKMDDHWGEESCIVDQLRAAWLHQLGLEFENICYHYSIQLQLPVFELSDGRRCLGSWHGSYRLLTISTYLIRSYPWETTLQVLKHEMAHQICSELLDTPDEGHGLLFKKACSMIGLSGSFTKARSDCGDFAVPLENSSSPQTEIGRKILTRVEKLLALAGSDNQHEAALAMQRAGELLCRHNLSIPAAGKNQYLHVSLNTGKQRIPGHLRGVGSLLQQYFFVRVVFSSVYDPKKNVALRTIELFGRAENVAVAEHCYHFLLRRLDWLWLENKQRFQGTARRARNSYYHGVVAGFRQKLAAGESEARQKNVFMRSSMSESVSSLVTRDDSGLESFIALRYPRLVKAKKRKTRVEADVYDQAVAVGKTLVLHRAMEKSACGCGGLLE